MQFILHIGQSKTGTTALQRFLSANRAGLVRRGILYPDVQLGGIRLNVLNHNPFADSLAGEVRHPHLSPEEYIKQFREQAVESNCHTILLSAESFFGGAPQP